MQTDIFANGIELDNPLRVFVDDAMKDVERWLGGASRGPVSARVEIGRPSSHHNSGKIFYAEANLHIGGELLRASCEHEDLRNAITDVKHELERQIKKFKERNRDLSRQPQE